MPELCAGLGVYEFRKMTLLGFSPTEAEVKRLLDLGYKVAPLLHVYSLKETVARKSCFLGFPLSTPLDSLIHTLEAF